MEDFITLPEKYSQVEPIDLGIFKDHVENSLLSILEAV